MARPAKLSDSQCQKARILRSAQHVPVPQLAKRFRVSESSMYKVLDGSYQARGEAGRPRMAHSTRKLRDTNQMKAATPNLFPDIQTGAPGTEIGDDVVLAAAQLIVARSRFARMISH